MSFTLWDVEHGLAMWIKTPNGQNHWIDAGQNTGTDFSPAQHISTVYHESELDYLIVSHPDSDHINDLPEVIEHLGRPRVLCRNKSLPDFEKYGNETRDYQRTFRELDVTYTQPIAWENSPENPSYNGGIRVTTKHLDWSECGNKKNNSSVVAFYEYADWLFLLPGDIDPDGWVKLSQKYSDEISQIVGRAKWRILVAPHHGTPSGYSASMMDLIDPHLVLVSDDWGGEETDGRYRVKPRGLQVNGQTTRYLTTKNDGANPSRIKVVIYEDGRYWIQQLGEDQA